MSLPSIPDFQGLLRTLPHRRPPISLAAVIMTWLMAVLHGSLTAGQFQAGASVVDIAPEQFPVIANAMFTERTATNLVDPLEVRALVLDNGRMRIAFAVVDTCMMSRALIEEAKAIIGRNSGIPREQILISATHTHSAPSAMACLGSRIDPRYAAMLPGRIARSIQDAIVRMQPARIGSTTFDASGFTHNRRWIRRLDRIETDPFGERTVRAHMHPGHQNPDAIGPSGPVDPVFSLLSIVTPDGRPIAVVGNFSMHYYESPLLSSDYFGKWRTRLEDKLLAGNQFTSRSRPVAILTQGTSGDLMWMDYGAPRQVIGYEAYAAQLADKAATALKGVVHVAKVPMDIREQRLSIDYRLCDPARLDWSRGKADLIQGRLPQSLPEIYALEQIHLHDLRRTEIVLQAVRIGDLAINALPNEVFAITGLKLKAATPAPRTMNISLANGGDGYIPPPEQHALGGYTTWAARTAGLSTNAEPRIVESLLQLQESVWRSKRRDPPLPSTDWAAAIKATRPAAWWPLDEFSGPFVNHGRGPLALNPSGYIARFLPGPGFRPTRTAVRQVDGNANHGIHLADGSLMTQFEAPRKWTLAFWFWNGLPNDALDTTAELVSISPLGANLPMVRIQITGSGASPGHVVLQAPNASQSVFSSQACPVRTWHHLALVHANGELKLFLDGMPLPPMKAPDKATGLLRLEFGGGGSPSPLQGRLDEITIHRKAMSIRDIGSLVRLGIGQ